MKLLSLLPYSPTRWTSAVFELVVVVCVVSGCGARDALESGGDFTRISASAGGLGAYSGGGSPGAGHGGSTDRNDGGPFGASGATDARPTSKTGEHPSMGGAAGGSTRFSTGGSSHSGSSVATAVSVGTGGLSGTLTVSGGTFATGGWPSSSGLSSAAGASSGGGSRSTGGRQSSGGIAGLGGATASLTSLIGDYDIQLDLPDISDCQADRALTHLNASIVSDTAKSIAVSVFLDWAYPWQNDFHTVDDALVVSPSAYVARDVMGKLRLNLSSSGFVGTGTADVLYACPSGVISVVVPASIGPDLTSPRLRIFGGTSRRVLMPCDLFFFDFSEPVVPENSWLDALTSFADPPNSVRVLDAELGHWVDYSWANWPWGPPTVVKFNDRTAMNGRAITLEMLRPFADHAGNQAMPERSRFEVLDTGIPIASENFEHENRTHDFGDFTYLSPESPDYACGSGNCLAMDYVTPTCIGWFQFEPSTFTFWTARIPTTGSRGIDIRYRILGTIPRSPQLRVSESPGCSTGGDGISLDLEPLDAPIGEYAFGTAWTTLRWTWCMGSAPDVGMVISLDELCLDPPGKFRLLLESIDVFP